VNTPASAPNPPRRLALCLEYPIDLQGGVSALCRVLARELSAHHEIVLVSADTDESFARSETAAHVRQFIRWDPQMAGSKAARQLADALVSCGVGIAHFHTGGNFGFGSRLPGGSPIPHLARRGVATCSTVHLVVNALDGYCGPQKPLWFKLALWPVAWCGKMQMLLHVGREIVVSRHGAQRLAKWYWPLRERFETVYHSRLSESEPPGALNGREQVILNVGHLALRKGQHVLAEAFARIAPRHPGWKLVFLGGVQEAKCEEHIRRIAAGGLESRIELAGERTDAVEFMRRAAVFVQPSFFEGLPLALQEALLMQCACVATDIPGHAELISHGENGLLVGMNDVDGLSSALERLIGDTTLRHGLAARARASVLDKGMSVERMILRHLELYESLLSAC
jgi:glycosyltransferase involved in cell wall biosynthesis